MSIDSALGAALEIPKSALDKIKEADDKLVKLQQTANDTASSVKTSFANMGGNAKDFIGTLDQIISKLGTINTTAKGMSGSLSNIGATKATQDVTRMNGAIVTATTNIDRMSTAQKGIVNSSDFAKSISDWQNLQTQIDTTSKRQQELTNLMRQHEIVLQNIRNGKGGVVSKEDQESYKAVQKEFETNEKIISSLRDKQQQIVNNNQALSKQIELVKSLRTYGQDYSFSNEKYKAEMQQLKEAIQLRAKKANEAQKQSDAEAKAAEKAAEREQKAREKEAKAAEKAAEREQKAAERKSKTTGATVDSALSSSQSATTLRDHIAAIKELQQARLNLVTTDKNYKQNLATINEAIKQHSKVLKDAGLNARNLGEQYSYLSGYLSRLAQRTAVVFSMSAAKNFVENVAEVRGQMEMSQRSLESILQNKPKADEIFNKTVELAVKSPFRIKDLVDYTRQLSAYRIESDKLYDTTKRLADVSAGLGVDMGRLILAYGQVKAAAYLRGSEVRQFTEAGINMYGELQQYFKDVKGEAYTTAQIVDMISKRMVTFKDVEAIFQRMTDEGGTFYNMQEVQAETLQGKISNLHDALDVMLNDIGKDNEGLFKGLITTTTSLLDNWKAIANVVETIIALVGILYVQSLKTGVSLSKVFSVDMAAEAKKNVTLIQLLKNNLKSAGETALVFGKNLKAAIASNAWLIAITLAIEAIVGVYNTISTYNKKVKEAKEETIKASASIDTIVASYNNLAKAADGASKKINSKDLEKNINDRRVALQKLIDLAAKDGLDLKINVDTINAENLDKTLNDVKKKYKSFINDIEKIKKNYATNDIWNTWITDGLDDNADDYKDAVVDLLGQSSKMEKIVATINANYDKASASTKKYYDIIRAGQKDGESQIDYLQRMATTISNINKTYFTENQQQVSWWKDISSDFNSLVYSLRDVRYAAGNLEKDFDNVFGDLRKKYNNDPIQIQAVIDKIAAEKDWSQYERDLAYQHFGINVFINKSSIENEVNWVDDYLSNFFANKKYGINLVAKEITDDKALEDFLNKGDDAAKAAKNWRELEKRLASVGKNQKEIEIDESIRKIFKSGEIRAGQKYISVSLLRQKAKEYKKAAEETANALGVDPFEKENAKKNKQNQKEQRDILQERINLLKDMNSKYDELIKTESKEQALFDTRKYFKEAAQNVGWNANDIFPDDQSVIKRIRELGKTATDVGKRGGYFRIAADIEVNIDKKEYEKLKTDISRNVDDAFSQLELYKKLKGEGLSDVVIKSMFGDISSSFEQVGDKINDEFNKYTFQAYQKKYGKDINKWGNDIIAQYNAELNNTAQVMAKQGEDISNSYIDTQSKLSEKIKQDTIDTFVEITKAYKTQLSDQLQLDVWYTEEKNKILTNQKLQQDPELQNSYLKNLDKQYSEKHDANEWKAFQNSGMYISLFENLDQASSRTLSAMKRRLEDVRVSLKALTPEQLKQVVNQITALEEKIVERNPYKALTTSLKTYISYAKQRKSLETKLTNSRNREAELKKTSELQNSNIQTYKQEYEAAVQLYGEESEQAGKAKERLDLAKAELDSTLSLLVIQGKITKEYAEQVRLGQQAQKNTTDSLSKIGSNLQDTAAIATDTINMLNAFGANIEVSEDVQEVLSGIDKIGSSLNEIDLTKPFSIIKGSIGVITGIGQTLGGIFGWGTKDKKLQKQIEKHAELINDLQTKYDKLKTSMDKAYDLTEMQQCTDKMVENLELQNKNLEAMIAAEKEKKKTDKAKIKEWQAQIDANNEAIKEAQETLTESLGGFGSQANYKSAAEAFAEAWINAFNEGSDALEALNDKFDEYFDNMLKKQLMARAASKFIQPILDAYDKALSKGSEGGNNGYELTSNEIAHIKELKEANLKGFDEYAKNLMAVLGVSPSGSSNLSNLQQGIQSVTETTAQALESILNSMRFFVSQQQSDIAAIRAILEQRLGAVVSQAVEGGASNQMLTLMEQQAGYLKQICDNWSSVMKAGHRQGGKGIRVFMD